MSKKTAVDWLVKKIMVWEKDHERWIEMPTKELEDFTKQAKSMEREQIEEKMAKAITFGWDLSHYHRHNTEEKLLQMQKDFIISLIKGGEQ